MIWCTTYHCMGLACLRADNCLLYDSIRECPQRQPSMNLANVETAHIQWRWNRFPLHNHKDVLSSYSSSGGIQRISCFDNQADISIIFSHVKDKAYVTGMSARPIYMAVNCYQCRYTSFHSEYYVIHKFHRLHLNNQQLSFRALHSSTWSYHRSSG